MPLTTDEKLEPTSKNDARTELTTDEKLEIASKNDARTEAFKKSLKPDYDIVYDSKSTIELEGSADEWNSYMDNFSTDMDQNRATRDIARNKHYLEIGLWCLGGVFLLLVMYRIGIEGLKIIGFWVAILGGIAIVCNLLFNTRQGTVNFIFNNPIISFFLLVAGIFIIVLNLRSKEV